MVCWFVPHFTDVNRGGNLGDLGEDLGDQREYLRDQREDLGGKREDHSGHREYLEKLFNFEFLCGAKPFASIKRESEGGVEGTGEAPLMPTGPAIERRQIK